MDRIGGAGSRPAARPRWIGREGAALKHMSIMRADHREAAVITDVVADAVQQLGVAVWLVPQRAERRAVLRERIRIDVEHALWHGEVHVADDRSAVALWLPHDGRPLPEPADYDRRLAQACGRWAERFQLLDRLLAAHHPEHPHHHLAYLAVRPGRQGEGLGSAMLRHHHARLDADGIAGYLEATSPPARDLFARHGYRSGQPFAVPDGTPIWPMWRSPS
jgi:ribosomal protein S18 acetylase RimI-like enzyme